MSRLGPLGPLQRAALPRALPALRRSVANAAAGATTSTSTSASRALVDSFGRRHTYLRISLAEKCNLRCKAAKAKRRRRRRRRKGGNEKGRGEEAQARDEEAGVGCSASRRVD